MEKKILKYLKNILLILVLTIITVDIFIVIHKKLTPTPKTLPPVVKNIPAYTDFHLLIPSLNVNAPVVPDVNGSDKDAYFKALQDGVAHFQGTAKPGEGSNVFIFGHSSYYVWDPGKYKDIFAHLEDIKAGDEIDLWYQSKEYKYIVTETKTVDPSDVSVLKPTPTEQLTLMTCVPVGTDKNRLVVVAKPK